MIEKVPLGQVVAAVDEFRRDALLFAEYQMDNVGSLWLKSNFPHIMAELEAMTFGWLVVPKVIVSSAQVLKGMVEAYRTNIGYSDQKHVEDRWVYQSGMSSILDYLETTVYPLLLRMPDDHKRGVETDAFAEAFTEDDVESDGRGQVEEDG